MESLIRWMENELDRSAKTHLPAPGLHRLNRTEYSNAIRDLLALEVDASKFLPTDDSTHGFDNIAGALTMSPALMEAYLSAAGKISRLAIGNVDAATQWVWDVPADTAQNHHIEGLPFGTRGGLRIEHQFPADGEYAFNVKGVTGYFQRVLGGITGEKLEILIDGERVHLFDWDKEISNTTGRGKLDAAHSGHRGPPRGRRDLPRNQRCAGHRAEQAVPAHDEHAGLDPGLHLLPARRAGHHRGAARCEGREGHGQPPAHLRVPAGDAARRRRVCAHDRLDAGEACVPTAVDRRGSEGPDAVLSGGPRRGRKLRRRHRGGAAARARGSRVHLPRRARTGGARGGPELSPERPRAGVPALVFPVEQHSRRRADRRGCRRQAEGSRGARAAGQADAGRSEVRGPHHELHGAVAERAVAQDRRARRQPVPRLRRQPAQRVPA